MFLKYAAHSISLIGIPIYFFGFYCVIWKTPKNVKSVKKCMIISCLWCLIQDIDLTLLTIPFILIPTYSGLPIGAMSKVGISTKIQTIIGLFIIVARNRVFKILPNLYPTIYTSDVFVISEDLSLVSTYFCLYLSNMIGQLVFFSAVTFYNLYFSKENLILSKNTRILQRKLFIGVCIQVTLPLTLVVFPFLSIFYCCVFNYHNQTLNNFMSIAVYLHGTLSVLTMIIIHPPYRKLLLNFFRCKIEKQIKVHSLVLMNTRPSTTY
ncbi:unnamed protein product [Caenorhabditis angaria]|uniref:Serpentine Receptor, class H n=1 Tax=Caenorhabditis angaria TaxID=860376 RepID=A0A9P1IVT3_9PELO|nr:unnamed protein product [Caenorhabditis angaria]